MSQSYAYFVSRPSRITDLRTPHVLEAEMPYEIVKVITLSKIDYENFTTDLNADRLFIEENEELCSAEEPYKCLLVKLNNASDGVLVVPEAKCFVGMAAYYHED